MTAIRAPHRPRLMTTDEYLALPVDEVKSELIYGAYVASPRPGETHNDLMHHLGDILHRWIQHFKLGELSYDIDVVFDQKKNLVYAPDLNFTAKDSVARHDKGRVYGVPDLCVEILSPSDKPWIKGRKFADYEHYGANWYWTVRSDPETPLLMEYELAAGKYVCRAEVVGDEWFEPGLFPGLAFRLAPLLAGEPLKAAVKGKGKKLM